MLLEAVLIGAVFGLIGALLGAFAPRIFYMHADTHWDPPATGIVLTTRLIAVLHMVGLFPVGRVRTGAVLTVPPAWPARRQSGAARWRNDPARSAPDGASELGFGRGARIRVPSAVER